MSLTSFLETPEVRAKFWEVFPKPLIKLDSLLIPPQTKNYSLIGTAFDYLLRFQLHYWYYPIVGEEHWIADMVVNIMLKGTPLYPTANEILQSAQDRHSQFLKTGELTEDLLSSCLELAQLDPIFRRSGYIPQLQKPDPADVLDLQNLIALVDKDTFKPLNICLLNPAFGPASRLVGGADVDLVIDQTLIDLKTTKNATFSRDYYNQILGYFILYRLGGISGFPTHERITHLGLYFSRFGKFIKFPVADLPIDEAFEKWFIQHAERLFHTDFSKIQKMKLY